jgi:hypothetical protein
VKLPTIVEVARLCNYDPVAARGPITRHPPVPAHSPGGGPVQVGPVKPVRSQLQVLFDVHTPPFLHSPGVHTASGRAEFLVRRLGARHSHVRNTPSRFHASFPRRLDLMT